MRESGLLVGRINIALCSHDFMSKKEYLEIDINDIGRFDPKLRHLLEDDPATHLPTVTDKHVP